MRNINFRVRMVGAGATVLVLIVFVQLNYLQIFHAGALNDNKLNTRGVLSQFQQLRGAIISADGETLAQSVPSDDEFRYKRQYPQGALFGQITGYFSFTYGTDGLEREYNSLLTQTSGSVTVPFNLHELKRFFTAEPTPDNLHITVLSSLQRLAASLLHGRAGAVVAISPRTGSVLAMYSDPSYDPNALASHDQATEQGAWEALNNSPGKPLLAAAYRQRFFPGSTFKVITSAAVFDHKPALETKAFPVSSGFVLPGTSDQVLHNFAGEACGGRLLEAVHRFL